MKIEELTPEIVTPIIEKLVEDFGSDYIYKKAERERHDDVFCRYQENGNASCIVGHVLDRAGVEYNPDWDHYDVAASALGLPEPVKMALTMAQETQDSGLTWGTALNAYKEELKA